MPVPDTSVLHATGGRTVETQPGDVRRARAARLYTGNLTFQKLQQTQSADPPPRSKVGGKPGGLIFFFFFPWFKRDRGKQSRNIKIYVEPRGGSWGTSLDADLGTSFHMCSLLRLAGARWSPLEPAGVWMALPEQVSSFSTLLGGNLCCTHQRSSEP